MLRFLILIRFLALLANINKTKFAQILDKNVLIWFGKYFNHLLLRHKIRLETYDASYRAIYLQ